METSRNNQNNSNRSANRPVDELSKELEQLYKSGPFKLPPRKFKKAGTPYAETIKALSDKFDQWTLAEKRELLSVCRTECEAYNTTRNNEWQIIAIAIAVVGYLVDSNVVTSLLSYTAMAILLIDVFTKIVWPKRKNAFYTLVISVLERNIEDAGA